MEFLNKHGDLANFYLRISMGIMLIFFTWMKWTNPEMVARTFQTFLGFGTVGLVYVVAVLLDLAAILLILGLWTRWVSIFLSLFFLVILVSGILAAQFMEAMLIKDVVFLGASLALLFGGAGAWSLDAIMART